MNDLAHIRTLTAQWRQEQGYADKGGVIVVYQNEVQGWVNELRDPQHWTPGCIATDSVGNQWKAAGGNEQDGAAEWQPIGIMNKEQIYDEQISPLVGQILAICKEHGIAWIANFAIPTEEDDSLQVLTNWPDENGKFPDNHQAAVRVIRPFNPGPMMLTTEHSDGSVTLTAII
ncbi:MAG: hypothetical protein K9L79_01505 [Methylobacter tundripaludum]|nr:hypothetical protein [Methylobacter tundripaludum]